METVCIAPHNMESLINMVFCKGIIQYLFCKAEHSDRLSEMIIETNSSLTSLLITQDQVRSVLNMKDSVKIVEDTYREYGLGKIKNPPKLGLDLGMQESWPDYASFVNSMPAYVSSIDEAGVKIAGEFRKFRKQGSDQGSDLIVLIDPRIGIFKAVLDGTLITNFRTGAQAAVGSKYLAKTKPKIAAVIGAGVIGRMTLLALAALIPLLEYRVFDIREQAARGCVEEMKTALSHKITYYPTLKETIAGADIVVTATTAKNPFINKDLIEPGQLFVTLSGNDLHDDVISAADKIVVDNLKQHLGHRLFLQSVIDKGIITEQDVSTEICEIVAGKKKGRTSDNEFIIFITRGMGCLDVAVATHVYRQAIDKGLGTQFSFVNYDPSNFL